MALSINNPAFQKRVLTSRLRQLSTKGASLYESKMTKLRKAAISQDVRRNQQPGEASLQEELSGNYTGTEPLFRTPPSAPIFADLIAPTDPTSVAAEVGKPTKKRKKAGKKSRNSSAKKAREYHDFNETSADKNIDRLIPDPSAEIISPRAQKSTAPVISITTDSPKITSSYSRADIDIIVDAAIRRHDELREESLRTSRISGISDPDPEIQDRTPKFSSPARVNPLYRQPTSHFDHYSSAPSIRTSFDPHAMLSASIFDDPCDSVMPPYTDTNELVHLGGGRNTIPTVASRANVNQAKIISSNYRGALKQTGRMLHERIMKTNGQRGQAIYCQIHPHEYLILSESMGSSQVDFIKYGNAAHTGATEDALRWLVSRKFNSADKSVTTADKDIVNFIQDDPLRMCIAAHNAVFLYSHVMILNTELSSAMHRCADDLFEWAESPEVPKTVTMITALGTAFLDICAAILSEACFASPPSISDEIDKYIEWFEEIDWSGNNPHSDSAVATAQSVYLRVAVHQRTVILMHPLDSSFSRNLALMKTLGQDGSRSAAVTDTTDTPKALKKLQKQHDSLLAEHKKLARKQASSPLNREKKSSKKLASREKQSGRRVSAVDDDVDDDNDDGDDDEEENSNKKPDRKGDRLPMICAFYWSTSGCDPSRSSSGLECDPSRHRKAASSSEKTRLKAAQAKWGLTAKSGAF